MDALSFNPLQNGAAATASIAADASSPDGSLAGIDFSLLLSLGLNAGVQEVPPASRQDEVGAETTIVPDAPTPELLIALAQQPASAGAAANDVTAHETSAAQTSAAPQTSAAEQPVTTSPAAVADTTAKIAADRPKAADPTQPQAESQSIDKAANATSHPQAKQDIAFDAVRNAAADATLRAREVHAAHIHPLENRPPVSQPSALLEVQAPVSEPGFAQALTRHVVWMVDKGAQIAELRINPPELGPVEVRLTLSQDSAACEFVSPHAEVRAAIESAIVRLREAMAEAGIQLGEASVSAESFSERGNAQWHSRHSREGYRDAPFADHAAPRASDRGVSMGRGLVDVFA